MHDPKEIAGRAAVDLVRDGMRLGLGTGSTVHFSLIRLADRIRAERLSVRCVPTSHATEKEALSLGIPLATLDEIESLDLTIDGADEIDEQLGMIKGGGGALLREKVVASISRRVAIVAGADKLVSRLGTTFALPVEVVSFAHRPAERGLAQLGCDPSLRRKGDSVFVTDNGNWILDCRFADGIADPAHLEAEIDRIPGVVESGLFVGLAHAVYIGREDGTCEVRRKDQSDWM